MILQIRETLNGFFMSDLEELRKEQRLRRARRLAKKREKKARSSNVNWVNLALGIAILDELSKKKR